MNIFTQPLSEYSELSGFWERIEKNRLPVRLTGCTDSEKAHLIAAAAEKKNRTLVIADNEIKARELAADLRLFGRNVLFYPAKDIIFYSADVHGDAIICERLKCLKRLASGEPVTVVASFSAGMDKIMSIEDLKKFVIHIDPDDTIDPEILAEKLVSIGYERTGLVENPGEFAIRGGIIDIYPLAEESPYRVELWGDEIDSIRIFDPSSQRSIENAGGFDTFPAVETVLSEEEIAEGITRLDADLKKYSKALKADMKTEEAARAGKSVAAFKENLEYLKGKTSLESYIDYFTDRSISFFDLFSDGDSVIFIDEPARVAETAEAVDTEFRMSMQGRLESGYILPGQASAVYDSGNLFARLSNAPVVLLSALDYKFTKIPVKYSAGITVRSVSSYNSDFEMLTKELTGWKKKGYRVILLTASKSRAMRLAQDLRDYDLNSFFCEDENRFVQEGEIAVISGSVTRGFEYPMLKFAVVCESDIFGKQKKKTHRPKLYEGSRIQDFAKLSSGDYVVHENYGVGIYRGIEKIEVDHVEKDYIKIEYAGGGTLYVLATAMDAVQKYSGPEGRTPKINKLDSAEWKNTKAKVRGAVRDIADSLVRLYAIRQAKQGYRFGKDTVWQKEFEETFPFEETDDQLKAIEDTKRDMESTKIMDRLICGDVGYGKTEIAIRAAFKAVQDGKQVAFLVPTTILAQQHYNTFASRMADYPVRVGMLSRFRTAAEQKKALSELKSGQLDIIIGTHRLLSGDVSFKNLGLLIVDEEQRFGVTHKEKIKQIKSDVDVLTLTATPIPRTLHMSLIGIRDMSVLDEPPIDRLPIQTFVMEHNDEIIREAVNRELARGGQVYYVYNRVNGISEVAGRLQKLLPDAKVVYAHGQMSERELEKVMFGFINGEIDVLVSTTIIETGLDISNVNTMIIDDADRLGLSQLYQLRGRVGRSSRTAYAFLMYKRDKVLKEVAEQRLSAIRQFTELGSGFKIAMRDLEIRGAGNLLGAEQSGQMSAVGYDLYCKLLNEAVKALKLGEEEIVTWDTSIDMDIDAFIPSSYIKNELQKLDMYKRIANIESREMLIDMQEELTDRYGDIPAAVNNLLNIALLKSIAHDAYVTGLTQKRMEVRLSMYEKAGLDVARIPELIASFGSRLKLIPGKTPTFVFTLEDKTHKRRDKLPVKDILEQTGEVLEALRGIKIGEPEKKRTE